MSDCPTVTDIRLRFPEFSVDVAPDLIVQTYLTDTCNYLDPQKFGDCFGVAALYYTAHLLAISIRTTKAAEGSGDGVAPTPAAGAISSSSAGGLSISFAGAAPASGSEAWFNLTPYGQHFVQLVKNCVDNTAIAGSSGYYPGSEYRVII